MTTKAQLYLNEQTTRRSFEEELAAKDRLIDAAIINFEAMEKRQLDLCDRAAEAMRAKCEEKLREIGEGYCVGGWSGERMGVMRCLDAIAALKGK